MRNRLISLVILLTAFSFGKDVVIPFNIAHSANVSDGDMIILKDFPSGWGYSRVVLGINATNGGVLSGSIAKDGCTNKLDGSYKQYVYEHTSTAAQFEYHGTDQNVLFHWWVDANSAITECSELSQTPAEELRNAVLEVERDAIETYLQEYVDLGPINQNIVQNTDAGKFKISQFPTEMYNMVYVSVEPADGEKLNADLYVGDKATHLSGWSAKISLQRRGRAPLTFELLSHDRRKIRLRWWVGLEETHEIGVRTETVDDDENVTAQYVFAEKTIRSEESKVSLSYKKDIFTDGNVPSIKKLDKLPPAVSMIVDHVGMIGDVYNVHAELKDGKTVSIALPIDPQLLSVYETIRIAHYIEKENRWEYIVPDEVKNGFVYFQASSFSWFSVVTDFFSDGATYACKKLGLKKQCDAVHDAVVGGAEWLYSKGKALVSFSASICEAIVDGVYTVVVAGVDLVYSMYDEFVNLICGKDFDKIINRDFKLPWERTNVNKAQGRFSDRSLSIAKVYSYGYPDNRKSLEQVLKEYSEKNLTPLSSLSESDPEYYTKLWKTSSDNLDVILADLLYSKISATGKRRFSFSISANQQSAGIGIIEDSKNASNSAISTFIQTSDDLLDDAQFLADGLTSCYGVLNLDGAIITSVSKIRKSLKNGNYGSACKEWLDGFGLVGWSHDAINATLFTGKVAADFIINSTVAAVDWSHSFNPYADFSRERDGWLQQMSSAMFRVSLLSWLDKTQFRAISGSQFASVYDGMRVWLDFASAIYGYNNISIKAYSSLALYEFIHYGTDENLNLLNKSLNRHYGPNGGFSEGTGYSQYVWDEVSYAVAALQRAYLDDGKILNISQNFLNSGKYMAEMSRPVGGLGLIPVEIDDGCTYNPDYLVWSAIYENAGDFVSAKKMAAYAAKWPLRDASKQIPLMAIGLPYLFVPIAVQNADGSYQFPSMVTELGKKYQKPQEELASDQKFTVTYKDGIGLITYYFATDTISLSMIAEDGDMWVNGQNHDQQDNLSITLSTANKGFLIQDRGYSGFNENNDKVKRFYNHNVVTTSTRNTITTDYGSGVFIETPNTINCSGYGSDYDTRMKCLETENEKKNRLLTKDAVSRISHDLSGDTPGSIWYYGATGVLNLADYLGLGGDLNDFRVHGGSYANVVRLINKPQNNLASISAKHTTEPEEGSGANALTNKRTIMYYEGNMWVIDRPSRTGAVWMANVPKTRWPATSTTYNLTQGTSIRLYGSQQTPITASTPVVVSGIRQNTPKADELNKVDVPVNGDPNNIVKWPSSGEYLDFVWHTMQDAQAKSYVALYQIYANPFNKSTNNCPSTFQCFETLDKSKRVVIPPYGKTYKVNEAFETSNQDVTLDGIFVGSYENSEWTIQAIDGLAYLPDGSTRTVAKINDNYVFTWSENAVYAPSDEFKNVYNPSFPLMLLR